MKKEQNNKLDAIEGCDYDNWGQPYQDRDPFRTTYNDMLERCTDVFAADTPMADTLQDAMVNFYPSTQAFSEYRGEDWVPENHGLFPRTSPWKKLDPTKKKPGEMKGRTCDALMDDGSVWTVTRVGPIVTTGTQSIEHLSFTAPSLIISKIFITDQVAMTGFKLVGTTSST